MKCLVLVNQEKNDYMPKECKDFTLKRFYKTEESWHRLLRKILLKLQITPLLKIIFSHWYMESVESQTIIVFDTGNMVEILKWLRKQFPNKRLIAWYWNSISDSIDPKGIERIDDVEIWSFDINDCKKHNYSFNTQFYFIENTERCRNVDSIKKDVFYVGSDKNRSKILSDLRTIFEMNHISYYYHLIPYDNSTNPYGFEYKNPMNYSEVLCNINESRVIIDLVAEWQDGITLRPLESIFFKKKLITNMRNIVYYDFYNKNNIFILGVDNIDELPSFIKSEYDDSNNNVYIKKYSASGWLSRFNI